MDMTVHWMLMDVEIAREVLDAGARAVRVGVTTDEIDDVVHEATIAAGTSTSQITQLFRKKAVGVMKAGQTFTIEPMINAGVWRDRMWPDGLTAVTADGKRSAQFEHILLVSETGVEVLTARLPTSPKVFPWLD